MTAREGNGGEARLKKGASSVLFFCCSISVPSERVRGPATRVVVFRGVFFLVPRLGLLFDVEVNENGGGVVYHFHLGDVHDGVNEIRDSLDGVGVI